MKNSRRAFTLIELLVVVLIVGILSSIGLAQYRKAVWRAKSTEARMIFRSVEDAVRRYYLANDNVPTSFDELDISYPTQTFTETQFSSTSYMNEEVLIDYPSGKYWKIEMRVAGGNASGLNSCSILLQAIGGNAKITKYIGSRASCTGSDCANFCQVNIRQTGSEPHYDYYLD